MGQETESTRRGPSDSSVFICLMEGKVGMQVAAEQVFGGPLSLIPWFCGCPKPDPSLAQEDPKHLSTLLSASG